MGVRKMTNRSYVVLSLALSALISTCSSGSGARNDQAPSGTVVAQGPFTSGSGNTISGNVQVYDQGGGNYIVRLENLSIAQPSASFQLQADISTSTSRLMVAGALQAYTGNVNYPCTAQEGSSWSVVYIHQPGNQTDPGIADLQ
jgi:hypothetical protein